MKKLMLMCTLLLWLAIGGNVHAAPGEYWELTSAMEGMGIAMPAQTSRECLPLKDEGSPAGVDKNCTVTDVKRIPNGSTFKISCKDGTTGSGRQTRTKDTLTSDMQMTTSDGSMKMSVKGKRGGGSCATDEKQKAVMGEIDKRCDLSNREYYPSEKDAAYAGAVFETYHKKGSMCVGRKDQACGLVKHYLPGDLTFYQQFATMNSTAEQQSGVVKSCGLGSLDSVRQSTCKANADNRKQMGALDNYCPAEAKLLRAKVREERAKACAGRQFTSPGDKDKCMAGGDSYDEVSAGASVNGPGSASTTVSAESGSSDAGKDPVEAGKKALKGLKDVFGF